MPTEKSLVRRAPMVVSRVNGSDTVIASAQRFAYDEVDETSTTFLQQTPTPRAWQDEGWKMYRAVGEFRYACDWVGSMLSKALIFATEYKDGKVTRLPANHVAQQTVEGLFNGPDGRTEMFRMFGIHFSVAGECWSISYPDPDQKDEGIDRWELVAPQNIRNVGSPAVPIWNLHGQPLDPRVDPTEVLVVRYWRPDPLRPQEAFAPTLGVLPYLREIVKASQHIAAQFDARLASAGIVLLPSSMSLPTPPDQEGRTVRASSAGELFTLLQKTMEQSLRGAGTARSRVPIIITADAEDIAAAHHMKFWTELDEKAIEMRNDAVRKLALGMDMPPEVLEGTSDSNHWNAWQADESAIKAHTEPLLKLITSSLADGILRPAIKDDLPSGTNLFNISIQADTSEMRLRPNRSKEAIELFELGLLSAEAVLRETGFDEADLPGEDEIKLQLLRKVASGSTTPELVAAALFKLKVLEESEIPKAEDDGETQEARPRPSIEQYPQNEIPDREVSEARRDARQEGNVPSSQKENRTDYAALTAAADQVVIRAMERAGNKLKAKLRIGNGGALTAAASLYLVAGPEHLTPDLLDDAWAHVPALAERHGVDPENLTRTLGEYCEDLLSKQQPHEYDRFARYIRTKGEQS